MPNNSNRKIGYYPKSYLDVIASYLKTNSGPTLTGNTKTISEIYNQYNNNRQANPTFINPPQYLYATRYGIVPENGMFSSVPSKPEYAVRSYKDSIYDYLKQDHTDNTSSDNTNSNSSTTLQMTTKSKPQTQHRGETVAQMWTRLTGTPWKTAKELGLTDGSYESNIKVLKDLKAGQYTKDYVSGLVAHKNNPTGEPLTIKGAYGPQDLTPQEQIGVPVDTSNWGERVTTTPQRYNVTLPDYGFVAESPFVTAESRMDADAQSAYDETVSRIGGYYR